MSDRGLLLALETSAERAEVALFAGEACLAEAEVEADERHAASLLVCVQRALAHAGADLDAVDRIALAIGPGSFTGLRIGLASALGLAFASERRLVPVPTLAALAFQAGVPGLVAPLIDARRGEVYAGLYDAEGRAVAADSCCAVASFLATLPAQGEVAFVGTGALCYRAELAAALGSRARFLPESAARLRARSVGRLGLRIAAAGGACAPEAVELRYLRRAEAETQRSALHQKPESIP